MNQQEITLIGATIGASAALTAQIVSHWFTRRRENEKYIREIYQKLYAPIIMDIFAYFDIKTNYRRGHDIKDDVNEDEIKNKIIDNIGNNLMYANPRILNYYYSTKKNDYYEDFSDGLSHLSELNLFLVILDELTQHARKMKLFDSTFKKEIIKYKVLYLLWTASLNYYNNSNLAFQFMSHNFYFDKNYSKQKVYKRMNNLLYRTRFKDKLHRLFKRNTKRDSNYNPISKEEFIDLLNHVIKEIEYKNEIQRVIVALSV
ncbi:hypothetical protein DC345_00355 [Paenibacillus taichungensis]|uniref:Phage abortive infection protein n=1 Tax=Paenibacillus taichungensis TaxID=484184 RepID=A0A329R3I0_9BACL|nr:hypothetical protein [Paenibacillus taichungensis]RAW19275.1 hypothetical protein DC345_00355 [Paenibacillus taichungensis]